MPRLKILLITTMNALLARNSVTNDTKKTYHESHIFVFPSFYPVKSQSIALLEVMASGCAIISSSAGQVSQIFSNQGILVETSEAKMIAEWISQD